MSLVTFERRSLSLRGRGSLPPQFRHEELKSMITPRPSQTLAQKLEATTALEITTKSKFATKRLLLQALQTHSIFCYLQAQDAENFTSQLKCYEIGAEEMIYVQGFPASNFYILESGRVALTSNEREAKTLSRGECFGYSSLVYGNPRTHTAVSLEDCTYWSCDNKVFQNFFALAQASTYETIRTFCYSLPLFSSLSPQQMDNLSKNFVLEHFAENHKVIAEGETGNVMYFIKSGEARVLTEGREVRRIRSGDFFGEQAILYGGFRTASIVAATPFECLVIDKRHVFTIFSTQLDHFIYLNTMRIALDRSPHLQMLTDLQKERIVDALRLSTFGYDEVVIPEGTHQGSSLWIVLNGSLRERAGLTFQGRKMAELYDSICDNLLSATEFGLFSCDIVADNDEVAIAEIGRLELEECINGDLERWVAQGQVSIRDFKGIALLENLPLSKQIAAARLIEVKEYAQGTAICEQGKAGDCMYILKKGKVNVVKDNVRVRMIRKHDYFGEKSLLNNQPRTASVFAVENCTIWQIHKVFFNELFDDKAKSTMSMRIERMDETINLSELQYVKKLGDGQYGIVFLVFHDRRGPFALKVVQRSKITCDATARKLQMERNILMQVNHSQVMQLIMTFKDFKAVYFLTEYIAGRSLYDVLQEMGSLTENDARFYFASIVSALSYLHERDIMHRDLKPDNIMIDKRGYVKLIDFGAAKMLRGRTYTTVGSPHYMAPEIVSHGGYNSSADLWSVGIMLYEFLCGRVPFGDAETDPYFVLKAVQEEEIQYPSFLQENNACKGLIQQLLSRVPSERGHINDVMRHRWLRNFDWAGLTAMSLAPPKIPKVEDYQKALGLNRRRGYGLHQAIDVSLRQDEQTEDDEIISVNSPARGPDPDWDLEF